jgi:tetratricopeptide (TPR) repeat protein
MNVHFDSEDDVFVPPTTRHEHRIAVYPEARRDVLLRWYRTRPDAAGRRKAADLARELVDYWLAEADRRRRDYRFMAAVGAAREALQVDPTPDVRAKLREAMALQTLVEAGCAEAQHQVAQRRFPEAIATLNQVLAVKPDLAEAHGRLGTLYATAGERGLADEHLRAVAKYNPNDAYGDNMLGWLAYLGGRPADAVEDFRRAEGAEPYSADISYRKGLALLRLGRLPEAAGAFRRAVAIDPNHAGGCQGLSDALRRQGEAAEALRYARRAARLTRGENPDVLLTLAEAYAAAGRPAEADDAAAKALDVARKGDPRQFSAVRRRVDEMRARPVGPEVRQ